MLKIHINLILEILWHMLCFILVTFNLQIKTYSYEKYI